MRPYELLDVAVRTLAASLLVASVALVARKVAGVLLPRAPTIVRLCGAIATGLLLATIGFHVLIAAGWFAPLGAAALGSILVAAAWRMRPRGLRVLPRDRDRRAGRRIAGLLRRSPHSGRVRFFATFALLLAVRALIIVPLGADTLVYHGPRAAMWVQQQHHDVMHGPGQWNVYRAMFGGGEALLAWAMLPFDSDLLVPFVDAVEWMCLFAALLMLARELQVREPYASTGAAFAVSLPTMLLLVGAGYVEIGLCLTLVLGLAFAVRWLRTREAASSLFACAGLGLAAGIKLTAVPPALLVGGAVLATVVWRARGDPRRLRWLAVGALLLALPVCPWLLQNLLDSGLPLSPHPLSVAGIKLGSSPELEWFAGNYDTVEPYRWQNELLLLLVVFPTPGTHNEALGFLSPVGLPWLAIAFGVALRRGRGRLFLLPAVAALAILAAYYSPGFAQVRMAWPVTSSRWLMQFLVLAAPLSLMAARPGALHSRIQHHLLWWITAVHLVLYTAMWWQPLDVQGTLGAAAVGLLLGVGVVRFGRRTPRLAPLLAITAFVALLHTWKSAHRYDLARQCTTLHPVDRYWVDIAEAVDHPDQPATIAITSGPGYPATWPSHYLLGSRLQNHLVYVSPLPDASIPPFFAEASWQQHADLSSWRRRLVELGVGYVVSFDPASIELAYMEAHPDEFRWILGIPHVGGLFRFAPQPR